MGVRLKSLWILLVSSMALIFKLSADYEQTNYQALHEAYATKAFGPVYLKAIEKAPPAPLIEEKPANKNTKAIWMTGYWDWAPQINEYIWVTGFWRVPPPGMRWIPGEWKKLDEGWVRLKGFWSSKPIDKITKIDQAPPDPILEKPPYPDSSNYFWNPGCWMYEEGKKAYEWLSGAWELLDPNWVIVPSHYEWREGGYLFIPAYWDWPLDRRGTLYVPLIVSDTSEKQPLKPTMLYSDVHLYNLLIANYPDYLLLCMHIYHFHPEKWSVIAPTWWQWHSWWALPWYGQWSLWWWFTHSDYVEPAGLTPEVADRIRQPNPRLLQVMTEITPPFIITPKGVVAPHDFFMVLTDGKPLGSKAPIVPMNSKILDKLKEEAYKNQKLSVSKEKEGKEVEPALRGKLHGFKELKKESQEPVPAQNDPGHLVEVPNKPVMMPASSNASSVEETPTEPSNNYSREIFQNPEIKELPVKMLKEARRPLEPQQPNKFFEIPHPSTSIVQDVMPGTKIGPKINPNELQEPEKEQNKK